MIKKNNILFLRFSGCVLCIALENQEQHPIFSTFPHIVIRKIQLLVAFHNIHLAIIMPFRFEVAAYPASIPAKETINFYCAPFGCTHSQRITQRRGGCSADVYENTSRKPTTLPTKLAEDRKRIPQGSAIINAHFPCKVD